MTLYFVIAALVVWIIGIPILFCYCAWKKVNSYENTIWYWDLNRVWPVSVFWPISLTLTILFTLLMPFIMILMLIAESSERDRLFKHVVHFFERRKKAKEVAK